MAISVQQYLNEHGKMCYRGVQPDTPFSDLEFHTVPIFMDKDRQVALHTNLGTLTVLDRMTGYTDQSRDTETGYRAPDGAFWLASGMMDVRKSGAKTMQDAISWVKRNANTCQGLALDYSNQRKP